MILWLLACGEPVVPEPAQEPTLPADVVPLGWGWVTDSVGGFELLFPVITGPLPSEMAVSSQVQTADGPVLLPAPVGVFTLSDQQMWMAYSSELPKGLSLTVAATLAAIPGASVLRSEPWREVGLAHALLLPDSSILEIRILPHRDRVILLAHRGVSDPTAFFESLRLVDREPLTITHHRGGFSVQCPARCAPFEDRSAAPTLYGVHGILDGKQFAVSYTDGHPTDDPTKTILEARQNLMATFQSDAFRPENGFQSGFPSHRFWFNIYPGGADVVGGRGLLTLRGDRLFSAQVYSPNSEPDFVDVFFDSLVLSE